LDTLRLPRPYRSINWEHLAQHSELRHTNSSLKSSPSSPRELYKSEEGVVLQSITMPTKNFFLLLSLIPIHSSRYPFLYSHLMTGMLLNCHQPWNPLSGTTLNCNLTQTSHDMPTGHVGHLGHLGHLGHWMYCGMPSGPYVILGHLRQLRHPSHLGHLGHLGNIGDLNPLDPSTLDPAPTDSLPGAFITEMDPMDPGPSQGCYADDSLDPLHTAPLEPYTSQSPLWDNHTRQMPLMGMAPSRGYS
jgi:hypothetical protein